MVLVLVYDYPACQAALAKCAEDSQGRQDKRRFEGFLNRVELANGYCELTDVAEQAESFCRGSASAQAVWQGCCGCRSATARGDGVGLPECAGVAMGVDRLLMQLQGADSIDQVMAFSWKRC